MNDLSRDIVVGNVTTLACLGVLSATYWLFLPYLKTLAWAQLVAFSLRGPRDRLKRGKETDARAAFRLLCIFGGGVAFFGAFFGVGLARDQGPDEGASAVTFQL